MIKFKNIEKKFDNGFRALTEINLNISKNEFVYLVGPSGSGKSTLLNLLFRREKETKGSVYIDQFNLNKLNQEQVPYLRRNIGMIFQDFKLLPNRTVYENIAFALMILNVERAKVRRQVSQVLELVNLQDKMKHMPSELSGGEQQRICIARAIVNHPSILLADEPTGSLDPNTSWEIMQLLSKINTRKTTILVATHNKSIVETMPRRVIALDRGRIIRDQPLGGYEG